MDLWIRSQDKKYLIPIHDTISVFANAVFYQGIILGTYKSEAIASKVLDEIENFIYTEVNIVNSSYEAADIEVKSKILCNMSKIFEMPEE